MEKRHGEGISIKDKPWKETMTKPTHDTDLHMDIYTCGAECHACSNAHHNIVEISICRQLLYKKNYNNKVIGLDIGAHIGYYGMALKNQVKEMYSFEMSPHNFKTLRRNTINNPHIIPFNVATWDSAGNNDKVLIDACVTHNQPSDYDFSCVALDFFTQLPSPEMIGFIKMDIEGAETHTLRGMQRMLNECTNTVLAIEYCKKHFEIFESDPKEYFDILSKAGFIFAGPMRMDQVHCSDEKDVLNLYFVK